VPIRCFDEVRPVAGACMEREDRLVSARQATRRERNSYEYEAFCSTRHDRFGQFAVASARMAVQDTGLNFAREDRERVGAMMGSALAGVAHAEEQLGYFLREGARAVDPLLALTVFGGAAVPPRHSPPYVARILSGSKAASLAIPSRSLLAGVAQ
jgi:3-oxoacyl-(acyl-carrier-protein) synthase